MKIHGFVGNREVTVDLPVERIAELGIDPWRLDLLDPDPVTVEVCGKSIGFSRLSDVVFAYTKDETVFVGVRDGKTAVCFYGDKSQCDATVIVTGFKVSSSPFLEHLVEYLTATATPRPSAEMVYGSGTSHGQSHYSNAFYLPAPKGPKAWYDPMPCCALTVCGDKLVVDDDDCDSFDSELYHGAMFEMRTIAIALPDEINWVHQALGRWNATIIGAGLFRALHGEKPASLDILVNCDDVTELKRSVEASQADLAFIEHDPLRVGLMSPMLEIVRAGCNYRLFKQWDEEAYFDEQRCTVGSIRSAAANQVSGTRIGFADLAQRLVRYIKFVFVHGQLDVGPRLDLTGFDTLSVEHIGEGGEPKKEAIDWSHGGMQT